MKNRRDEAGRVGLPSTMSGMSGDGGLPLKADMENRNQPIIGKREMLGDVITAYHLRIRGMKRGLETAEEGGGWRVRGRWRYATHGTKI